MINSKTLIAMARKWVKSAMKGRKRISMPRATSNDNKKVFTRKPIAKKGNFVFYTSDGSRFSVPLGYLGSPIFQELLQMSEDEYGLPRDGPIVLPCKAIFVNYVVSLIQSAVPEDIEKAVLLSMDNDRCSTSSYLSQLPPNQLPLVHGY